METKLGRFCDGLLAALWLAALIIVPLFFNVYSSRIFEPDKVAILRTISLAILGAWLVKLIEVGTFKKENLRNWRYLIQKLWNIPLLVPVFGLAIVYIIATIFSVAPVTSLLGSYQRLQGTYTTFSYLIIFFSIIANLRSREQVERIITIIALTSLPIALYGVLQHYNLDPVPWEGDVTKRIASTMGNSIFVAAFLIMAFPMTLKRIYEYFRALLIEDERVVRHMVLATIFVTIAILQIIAIYLSQSRGPFMGLVLSVIFLAFLWLLMLKKRWIGIFILALSIFFGGFFYILNIEQGPLESLRNSSVVGRFGHLLDPQSNSALVRQYIWEGSAKLVSPHEPLQYPDDSLDRYNFLRPIIGYGPESMFVAYNPFYVPELGRVEKRNASPDRSHNETWDALINTGLLGLVAYVTLFTAIFYYSLNWLGLINNRRNKWLFFAFYTLGGVFGTLGLILWRGIPYIGIGIPFGFVIGLFLYLVWISISQKYERPKTVDQLSKYILISVLVGALLGHFIEINFGISIVATRTYFWFFTGLLVVVGYFFSENRAYDVLVGKEGQRNKSEELSTIVANKKDVRTSRTRREHNSKKKNYGGKVPKQRGGWIIDALIPALLLAIILVVLGFDLIGNPNGLKNPLEILWNSFTHLKKGASNGIMLMIVVTWLLGGIAMTLELPFTQKANRYEIWSFLKQLLFILGLSFLLGFIYWIWHTANLSSIVSGNISSLDELFGQVSTFERLLTNFYIYIFFLLFTLAGAFTFKDITAKHLQSYSSTAGVIATIILFPIITWLAVSTNLRVVQADIVFRIGGSFARPGQWPVAVEVYKRANQLAPREDYYYLSLAGAYFEQAKAIDDPIEREKLMRRAEHDLLIAQSLNPLNTDHTANLARLYNLWAAYSDDAGIRQARLEKSSDYYSKAVTLSPQNARLWDEWALLYLNGFKQPEEMYKILNQALEIDPEYDWTHGLLGDYYARKANQADDPEEKRALLEKAASEYEKAISFVKYYEAQNKYSYIIALAGTYAALKKIDQAIDTYNLALEERRARDIWRIEDSLARLYFRKGDIVNALLHARIAYENAPEEKKQRIEELIQSLGGTPE